MSRASQGLPQKFPVNLPDPIFYAFQAGYARRDRRDAMQHARRLRGEQFLPEGYGVMVDLARKANHDMVRYLVKARRYLDNQAPTRKG